MKKITLYLLALISVISSCTERIDINLDETYTRLVVYGMITTDTTTHYIELSRTSDYYYNEAPPPVTGAKVEISDDQGNVYVLTESKPGKYGTAPLVAAVAGRTYTLRVELAEEINGHKIYMASSGLNPIYAIDSIGLVHQPDWGEQGFYEVTCYYQDPPTKDFYLFNIYKNNELLTDTINERFATDDELYNGNYTNGIGVGFLDQSDPLEVLMPGDVVTFQALSITEEYYDFVVTLQTQTGFQTPLFSGPPANVVSNVNNGAVGIFTACATSYSSKVFQAY